MSLDTVVVSLVFSCAFILWGGLGSREEDEVFWKAQQERAQRRREQQAVKEKQKAKEREEARAKREKVQAQQRVRLSVRRSMCVWIIYAHNWFASSNLLRERAVFPSSSGGFVGIRSISAAVPLAARSDESGTPVYNHHCLGTAAKW